jgi:hypothetical protein
MLVLLADEAEGIVPRRVGFGRRLLVALRQSRLDRELAAGVAPESSLDLAVHADLLARPEQRTVLAAGLREIMTSANTRSLKLRVPLVRDRIREAGNELEAVAGRLGAPGPVSVQGLAMLRTLLTDGTGPLFQRGNCSDLDELLESALRGLDPLAALI